MRKLGSYFREAFAREQKALTYRDVIEVWASQRNCRVDWKTKEIVSHDDGLAVGAIEVSDVGQVTIRVFQTIPTIKLEMEV